MRYSSIATMWHRYIRLQRWHHNKEMAKSCIISCGSRHEEHHLRHGCTDQCLNYYYYHSATTCNRQRTHSFLLCFKSSAHKYISNGWTFHRFDSVVWIFDQLQKIFITFSTIYPTNTSNIHAYMYMNIYTTTILIFIWIEPGGQIYMCACALLCQPNGYRTFEQNSSSSSTFLYQWKWNLYLNYLCWFISK